MPGWYPDPAGASGRFRYWNGTSWSQETTGNPAQGAPGTPTAFAAQPSDFTAGQRRGGAGWIIALALALLMALLTWALFFRGGNDIVAVEDHNSSSPPGKIWNEKESSPPSPSGSAVPAPAGGAMIGCPTGGGNVVPSSGDKLTSAGLTVDRIGGWDYRPTFELESIRDVQVQLHLYYQGQVQGWLSGQMVGRLAQADGFKDPRTSASQIMDCFATSDYYQDFVSRTDVTSEPVTIDGRTGWHLRTEIRVDSPGLPGIPGDRMDIVVLDTGEAGTLAIWSGWATIGDGDGEALIDRAMASLHAG